DEDDYFGVPVVQAARLCAAASGGEILCTETVRVLTGTRTEASFEAVGELDLKGLDEPLAAWRVRWEAAREASTPLPARVAAAINPEFVGRTAEHQVLTSAWKSAVAEGHAR